MPASADEQTSVSPATRGPWKLRDHRRNGHLADWWSLTHVLWAAALSLAVGPVAAFAIMVAWEPVEILVISPLLWRFGIEFGYESLQNSMGDIVFDGLGALLAAYLILPFWNPFGL